MGLGRSAKSVALVDAAYDILEEIQPASVRAVCYQLFTRGLIPSMAKRETDWISDLLARAREDEVVPWEWIVQEGRSIEYAPTWDDPEEYAEEMQAGWRRNR